MSLHMQKENVLLAWINSLGLGNPVDRIVLLQDGILFLKLICKLKGQEVQCPLDQPVQERLQQISDFLQSHCRYKADRGSIVSWENILNGRNLDIDLSKVVLLLMHHVIMNELLETEKLDHKTMFQMAAVLRFVLDIEDCIHLSDNMETFLKKPFLVSFSSVSTEGSISEEESPILKGRQLQNVKFLELMTVASSSAGSPMKEIMNTPQFQLKKVRKQLAEERDARDELERDLANASQLITEREKQISQLQHRVERLMRDNAEQAREPKELDELQNKNEGLQTRLHEVLKQCQDLKTDNSQMEKKIDQLTEENGNLSVKIRDIVSRLASAQKTVDTLSEEQQALQAEWESKRKFLEAELCQAVSQKESLNEQVQILQGKISSLEDELRIMQTQTQEQGEVMGPIMEWEKLNQEVSELTCKLSQLRETVLQLESEKGEMQIKYEMEKNKFESEAVHLQGLVSELQQTLLVHRGERESLEQTLKEQQAAMTTQISLMNAEIACLSETIKQKELAATALGEEVAAEQKQRGILQEKMEKREKMHAETIQGLGQQVEHLETFLKFKEEESSHQQTILKEASDRVICERDAISAEYHQFRKEKEEEVLSLNQQVRQLGELRQMELSIMSDLKRDKEGLDLKLATLECTVSDLMNGQEAERETHREAIAAELQRHSQMESEIMALETRVQQLLRDIELMGQRLNEAQKGKCDAESNVEELKIECRELSNSLSAERDYINLLVNERDTVIKTLQVKTEEAEKLEKETKECMVEIEDLTTAKRNGETRLNCVIEKHKAEICTLRLELTDLQGLVKQRESEKELLQNEISSKEEELKIQQEHVLNLQSATSEMEELRKNLAEEEQRHQMTKQGADARNEENRLLRITLDEKENQMSALQQNIHVLEEKAYDLQVVRKDIEGSKHTISELKTRLAEDQAQIREKTAAFEIQNQLVLSLQKDLVLEQERAVSLENDLRAVESVFGNQKVQEQKLRAEAIVHCEELEKHMADLEKLQQQCLLLEEEKREAERRDVTSSEKIAMLQVELQTISSQASESNASLEQVQKEFAAVSLELSSLKEKYNEGSKLADADCKRQEMTIEKLNDDLQSASSLASEKEQNIQMLQTEISSLKRELKEQQAVECLRDQEMNAIRSKCIAQEKKVSELQVQLQEASALASERESELCSLRCEMKVNDNLRLQAAAREEAQRKELEEKVAQLQVQLQETTSLNSSSESELHFLQTEVKKMNNLKVKAAETEEAQRREFENKIAQLQAQIVEAATLATEKESELQFLRSKVKEMDSLRHQAAQSKEAQCKELEEKVSEFQAQVLEASALASAKELELSSLHCKVKEMENLRLQAAEIEEARNKELEEKVSELQGQVLEASALASGKELELSSLHCKAKEMENLRLQAAEIEEARNKELEEKVSELQARVREASALASAKELELSSLHCKVKEMENLRLRAAEIEEARNKELEEKVSELQAQVLEASALASAKELELSSLHCKVKEMENLRLQAAEIEEARNKELEEKVSELQAQVLEASALASAKELELSSLHCKVKEMENLRLQAAEIEEARNKELEEKVSELKVQVLEASSLASSREAELNSLHCKVQEMDNLRHQAAKMGEAQCKELEEKIAQLEHQVLEASNLASEREMELNLLQAEIKRKDSLRLKVCETQEVQGTELKRKIGVHELQNVSALVIETQQKKETLREELKERDLHLEKDILRNQATERDRNETMATFANPTAKLLCTSEHLGGNAEESQQHMVAPKHSNVEHLSMIESLKKKEEFSQKLTEDLRTQLQLAVEELSALRPLKGAVREKSQLLRDLQEQLSAKSKALEHYKAQVENAKTHYNGKKQQLLEANEKIQSLTTALKTSQQEIETLKGQMKVFQEQAKATEKNLLLTINSLQAQLDYADKQLRELKRPGKSDEMKHQESVYQMIAEKQEDISGDSLDHSLDDSLNFTRIPAKREESSTPVVRSSERLKAQRRACGGESLETLYFTPMSVRSAADGKQESSINSLGGLVFDSARKGSSARRRTTQVINITMTKKTQGRLEADAHDGSFNSLQTAQSFPNIASQRDRPFSLDLSEESTTTDLLQHLPGYRRSAAPSAVSSRRISTFRVGAENEPDHSEDWMRIAELQARNQTCLPHLKSSYPLEAQPNFGNISFTITDDDLKTGDPDETIRRASMIPGQMKDSLASSWLSVQPSQVRDSTLSRRETMLPAGIGSRATSQPAVLNPKRCGSNSRNIRPLKRGSCDPQGPGTSEAKKLATCFPRPLTPKDRNDRHFASQNSQNRPPSTPVERRQSMMFSIDNTPNKKGKNSLLQKGINKVRASTRKSPGSTRKIPRSAKSPCPGKSPHGERPQRRSPRINSMKSPKIISSARKLMKSRPRMKM